MTASSCLPTGACVSAPPCATATWLPIAPSAHVTLCSRRRCSRGPRASCATWPRPVGTCYNARAASTSRMSRSHATNASRAAVVPRARAITATWLSSGLRRHVSRRILRIWPLQWSPWMPWCACWDRVVSGPSLLFISTVSPAMNHNVTRCLITVS